MVGATRGDGVTLATSCVVDCRLSGERVRCSWCGNDTDTDSCRGSGNAEDIGLHLDYIDALARATGSDVFSYEYVGYSLSRLDGAIASEAGCLRSVDAAWCHWSVTGGPHCSAHARLTQVWFAAWKHLGLHRLPSCSSAAPSAGSPFPTRLPHTPTQLMHSPTEQWRC